MSSKIVNDNANVTMREKKPRKPRAPKTAEPVVAEPVATEHVAIEPVATEHVAIEPVATEHVAIEPVATEHVAIEPVATEHVVETIEKKKRKSGLPAKYGKFLQFGFYLAETLKDTEGNVTINSYDEFIKKMMLFDTVDNQQKFVQTFFDQNKEINKSIKKMIANKKKADIKAAKLAAKPTKKNYKNNINNTNTDNNDFVYQVVSLANPKPKRKYNKKNSTTNNNEHHNNHDHDHNDEELDVEIIYIKDTNYLVDSHKRIFDFNNHNLIGHIDQFNNLVLL
jgi:hypothetical protein